MLSRNRIAARAFALCAALQIFSATPAVAAPDDPAIDSERDEYDFSWLDPDKKIYVVQNRKYLKGGRFELSTNYGVGMGETYRTQRQWNVRGTFYFSEHWGLSGIWFNNFNNENETMAQLKNVSNVVPGVRDTNRYFGGSLWWLPFYGKINLFNQIFYIDWHFELGFGSAQTEIDINTRATGSPVIEESSHGAFHWGSGWKFFINRHWHWRLDYLATYYKAPNPIRGTTNGAEDETYDNYYLTTGIGYTF